MAVSIRYQSGKKDTIYRRTDQSEEQFIAKAIRSVCHFVEKALPVMHI